MLRYPSTTTKLVALLGHPLGHSLSPLIHNTMFEYLGLDYCYLPVEVNTDNLAVVFNGLRRMNVVGCNVTIPHKVAIVELLDELDPQAALLGAVNTICFRDGRAIGYNTDGQGFLHSLKEAGMASVAGKNVFVLGAGGAARAIAMGLAAGGAGSIYLCNRNREKALALADEINEKIRPCAETVAAEQSAQVPVLKRCQLLVNTTSVGMHPHHDHLPIAAEALSAHLTVADIVYNPHTTRLLAAAQAAGCPVVHGIGMLIHQGALGFSLWTGSEPPVDRMLATALNHLAKLHATSQPHSSH